MELRHRACGSLGVVHPLGRMRCVGVDEPAIDDACPNLAGHNRLAWRDVRCDDRGPDDGGFRGKVPEILKLFGNCRGWIGRERQGSGPGMALATLSSAAETLSRSATEASHVVPHQPGLTAEVLATHRSRSPRPRFHAARDDPRARAQPCPDRPADPQPGRNQAPLLISSVGRLCRPAGGDGASRPADPGSPAGDPGCCGRALCSRCAPGAAAKAGARNLGKRIKRY